MAASKNFDARLESLVIETRTEWDPTAPSLTDAERQRIATAIHRDPASAPQLRYLRAHTGFTRIITVTPADVQRLVGMQPAPNP